MRPAGVHIAVICAHQSVIGESSLPAHHGDARL
jgi:hypothetical protein